MNVKKSSKKVVISARRGSVTAAEMSSLAKTVEELSASIDNCATRMRKIKASQVLVDGITKKDRGVKELREFVANLEHALNRAEI